MSRAGIPASRWRATAVAATRSRNRTGDPEEEFRDAVFRFLGDEDPRVNP
jgi:hypothetical protein